MDAEERALIAEANGRQEAAAEAAQAAAPEADDGMDLDDEDPSQMNIVRNYQRQDHRFACGTDYLEWCCANTSALSFCSRVPKQMRRVDAKLFWD